MSLNSKDGRDNERTQAYTVIRARGVLRVVLTSIGSGQLLTMLFVWATGLIDPGVAQWPILTFHLVSCALISRWVQIDARRAWERACRDGHVQAPKDPNVVEPDISRDCPKRWLVTLHACLHPEIQPLSSRSRPAK